MSDSYSLQGYGLPTILSHRLDKIVEVVREGQTRRAPIERVADLITGYFVPIITLLAILTWVIWLSLGLSGALPRSYLDIHIGGWSKLPSFENLR